MKKHIAFSIVIFTLMMSMSTLTQIAVADENIDPTYVRIDIEKIQARLPFSGNLEVTFMNKTISREISLDIGQEIIETIMFVSDVQEGIFVLNITTIDSTNIFWALGELTTNSARIVESKYNEKFFLIESSMSSITISAGSVSANFTLNVESNYKETFEVILSVQNNSQSTTVTGISFDIVTLVEKMPPNVFFTAEIQNINKSKTIARISVSLDFVKGVGADIVSHYEDPVNFLNLKIERSRTMFVASIPNTMIVKTPVVFIPLVQSTNPISIAFGTPPEFATETNDEINLIENITNNESSPSTVMNEPPSLIDLSWMYKIFESSWNIMLGSVLLLFIAVIVSKKVL